MLLVCHNKPAIWYYFLNHIPNLEPVCYKRPVIWCPTLKTIPALKPVFALDFESTLIPKPALINKLLWQLIEPCIKLIQYYLADHQDNSNRFFKL